MKGSIRKTATNHVLRLPYTQKVRPALAEILQTKRLPTSIMSCNLSERTFGYQENVCIEKNTRALLRSVDTLLVTPYNQDTAKPHPQFQGCS